MSDDIEKVSSGFDKLGEMLDSYYAKNQKEAELSYQHYRRNKEEFIKALRPLFNKDTWLVHSEALSILAGVHPSDWAVLSKKFKSPMILEKIQSDYLTSLKVINYKDKERLWRVRRDDFIKWAETNELPHAQAFKDVVNYYCKGLLSTKGGKSHGNSEKNATAREELYIASLGAIKHFHDKCLHGGRISANKVAKVVDDRSHIWWRDGEIPFERSSMEKILQKAFKLPD